MPIRPTPGKKWQVDGAWLDLYDSALLGELGLGSPEALATRDQAIAQASAEAAIAWATTNAELTIAVDAVERDAGGRITGIRARKHWRQKPAPAP